MKLHRLFIYSTALTLALSTQAFAQEPAKVMVPDALVANPVQPSNLTAQPGAASPSAPVVPVTAKTTPAAPAVVVTKGEDKAGKQSDSVEMHPLRKALAAAYLHNPQLESQRKAQNALDERVPQALSGALPTASIGYDKGRRRTDFGNTKWNYGDSKTRNLTVTQPIFRGGSTWANVKSARYDVIAGQARLKQTEQEVLLNTIRSYMDVVQTQSVVELSKKNLDVLGKQFDAANQRFEVGEDTRTDVAQSQARAASAKSDLIESEGRFAAAKAAFRRFVGYDAKDVVMPEVMPELPKSLEETIKLADEANPRLLEAQKLKESADYQINAGVGRLLPSVNLRGSMNRQEGAGVLGTSAFDQDDVMVAVSVPIFQGGAEYSRVREAREQYQQRRFSELDIADQVHQAAVSAWENWQAAKASIVSDQAAIDAAKIALDGVKQEQQYGARTTLDVLDAERELFNAEVKYVTSRRDEVVTAYTLLAAIGKLTAEALDLSVAVYDPNKHFEDVEYQFIGF